MSQMKNHAIYAIFLVYRSSTFIFCILENLIVQPFDAQ